MAPTIDSLTPVVQILVKKILVTYSYCVTKLSLDNYLSLNNASKTDDYCLYVSEKVIHKGGTPVFSYLAK